VAVPIINLQRRLRECGRIRLGEQRTTAKGKTYPAALPRFRFTSPDRPALDAVAALWGGTVRPWQAPAGPQWEVTVEHDRIDVILPPAVLALTQWYEAWSAAGCQRRCDGATDTISDGPCLCDPENRACQETTRLSVVLPQVPAFGLWRLETHGYYAAVELGGVVDVANQVAPEGQFLEAQLRIDQRTAKRLDAKGDTITQHYVVPVLDLGLTFRELLAPVTSSSPALPAAADATMGEAEGQAHSQDRAVLAPVPDLAPPPAVADQLDRLRQAQPRAPKVPLPPAGIDPETGEIVGNWTAHPTDPDPAPEPEPAPEGRGMSPPPSTIDPAKAHKRVMAEATKTWPDLAPADRDGMRHALGVIATYTSRQAVGKPPTQSVTEMSLEERLHLSTLMAQVRQGQLTLARADDDDQGRPRYVSQVAGGARVAHLTQLPDDTWDVRVVRTAAQGEAQP